MSTRDLKHPWKPSVWIFLIWLLYLGLAIARDQDLCEGAYFTIFCGKLCRIGQDHAEPGEKQDHRSDGKRWKGYSPGSRGSATRVSRVRSVRAWGPSPGPTACALAGRRCSLWGWRKGVFRGGAFRRCEGRLWSGAPPPPTARPLGVLLGSVTHMPWARMCGRGGPTLSPWPACSVALCPHTTGPTHPTVAPSWWASATATGSRPHAGLPLLHARSTRWC